MKNEVMRPQWLADADTTGISSEMLTPASHARDRTYVSIPRCCVNSSHCLHAACCNLAVFRSEVLAVKSRFLSRDFFQLSTDFFSKKFPLISPEPAAAGNIFPRTCGWETFWEIMGNSTGTIAKSTTINTCAHSSLCWPKRIELE